MFWFWCGRYVPQIGKLAPRLGGRRRIPPRCCWAARDTLPALGHFQRAWLNLAIIKQRLVKRGGMTRESVECAGTSFDRDAEDGMGRMRR